jgi:hypothetical protein
MWWVECGSGEMLENLKMWGRARRGARDKKIQKSGKKIQKKRRGKNPKRQKKKYPKREKNRKNHKPYRMCALHSPEKFDQYLQPQCRPCCCRKSFSGLQNLAHLWSQCPPEQAQFFLSFLWIFISAEKKQKKTKKNRKKKKEDKSRYLLVTKFIRSNFSDALERWREGKFEHKIEKRQWKIIDLTRTCPTLSFSFTRFF